MGTVDVVASDNDDGELETLLVGVDQHLGSGFAGSVWVCWCQNAGLEQIIGIISNLSIYLVGGNVNELLDPNLLGTLQQNVGTIDIGVGEGIRVTETQIDVGLCGEVEDSIDLVSLEAVHDLGGVGDVAMVEGEVALVVQDPGVVQGRAVIELVEGDNVVGIGVGQGQVAYQPASTASR